MSDNELLYRALPEAYRINFKAINQRTGNYLTPRAFTRRPPRLDTHARRDPNGFSVTLADGRDEAVICEGEPEMPPPEA